MAAIDTSRSSIVLHATPWQARNSPWPPYPYARTYFPRFLKHCEQCYWRSYIVLEARSLRAVSLQTTHACPRLHIASLAVASYEACSR